MNALLSWSLKKKGKKKMERIFHFDGIFFLSKMEIYRLENHFTVIRSNI